jgi:hypothetical protein
LVVGVSLVSGKVGVDGSLPVCWPAIVLQAVGRYAEVVEVALPVDPQQTVRLVVEEDDRYLYWVVYGSLGYWTGILVVYSTYKEAYVVPI